MSHVFVDEAVIPGKDDAVQLLGAFPEFADVMGVADNQTFDCRNPDRVNLPGQGRRPSKILAALREKSWHRRNYGLACLNDGVVADGGGVDPPQHGAGGVGRRPQHDLAVDEGRGRRHHRGLPSRRGGSGRRAGRHHRLRQHAEVGRRGP